MILKQLINEDEYETSEISLDTSVKCIATKPENAEEDCLFILENPSKMPKANSFKTLPIAIVASEDTRLSKDIPLIKVKSSRYASALIHSRFYDVDYSELKVIGVTGTNGKTTTAYIIYSILKHNNIKVGFIGTGRIEICGERISEDDYCMTTPDPEKLYKVLKKMQNMGCKFAVMEVSSHALALEKTAAIKFEYGIFTNLSPEHTDFHSSILEYFETKMKLLETSKKRIINIDDSYGRIADKRFKNNKISVGVLWQGDFYATNIDFCGQSGLSYYLHTDKICYKTTLSFPGKYNIYNSLLASSVCIDIGIAPCLVKKSISTIKYIDGRFEIINGEIPVIIDYAHTEEAYKNLLISIKDIFPTKKITAVFGCGGDRDRSKRPKIASIVEKYASKMIITEDNTRNEPSEQIFNDIVKGFKENNYTIIPNRHLAIQKAIQEASCEEIVAIIGKGAEKYSIDKRICHSLSDKEIVKEVLMCNEGKS